MPYSPELVEIARHQKLAQVNYPGEQAAWCHSVNSGIVIWCYATVHQVKCFPIFQATPPVLSAQGTSHYSHSHMHNSTIRSQYTEHNTHVCTLHTGNEPLLRTTAWEGSSEAKYIPNSEAKMFINSGAKRATGELIYMWQMAHMSSY